MPSRSCRTCSSAACTNVKAGPDSRPAPRKSGTMSPRERGASCNGCRGVDGRTCDLFCHIRRYTEPAMIAGSADVREAPVRRPCRYWQFETDARQTRPIHHAEKHAQVLTSPHACRRICTVRDGPPGALDVLPWTRRLSSPGLLWVRPRRCLSLKPSVCADASARCRPKNRICKDSPGQ
jgi:hypothetical protein